MNVIDIIILLFLGLFGFIGFRNGLIREVLGLVGVIAALFFAFRYLEPISTWIDSFTKITDGWTPVITFFLIFFLVIVVTHLLIIFLEYVVKITFMSIPNRLTGLLFGVLKSSLFVSVIFVLLAAIDVPGEETRRNSLFYKHIIHLAPGAYDLVAEIYPETQKFADSIQRMLDDYTIERY